MDKGPLHPNLLFPATNTTRIILHARLPLPARARARTYTHTHTHTHTHTRTHAHAVGISARRRKDELERLNEQLRTINMQLRQQARVGMLYAPGLTYVPPPDNGAAAGGAAGSQARPASPSSASSSAVTVAAPPAAAAADAAAAAAAVAAASAAAAPPIGDAPSAEDENASPEARQCLSALREGKRLLKGGNGGGAMVRFEKALMLAKSIGDAVKERRAVRGMAACSRLTGQPKQVSVCARVRSCVHVQVGLECGA
jgi:hypothetical protein